MAARFIIYSGNRNFHRLILNEIVVHLVCNKSLWIGQSNRKSLPENHLVRYHNTFEVIDSFVQPFEDDKQWVGLVQELKSQLMQKETQ